MQRLSFIQTHILFILALGVAGLWLRVYQLEQAAAHSVEPELHVLMSQMQTHLHKLDFAVNEQNERLSHFYLHELEEVIEGVVVSDIEYSGQPVSELTNSMLLPVFEELEAAVEKKEWEQVYERFTATVDSCNSCHLATGYGEIVITEKTDHNPFNQDFTVQP